MARKLAQRIGRPVKAGRSDTFAGLVGSRIRRCRRMRLMTLEQLAEKTGGAVTASMLSGYERGDGEPRLSKCVSICIALDVPLGYLIPPRLARRFLIPESKS